MPVSYSDQPDHPPRMRIMITNLNGPWTLTRCSTGATYPAQVPGCVWSDLLRFGEINNYEYRDEEATQQWIAAEDWEWQRHFEIDASALARAQGQAPALPGHPVRLLCSGIDTFADIWINDVLVASPHNMFRIWEVDIVEVLCPGMNTIRIRCHSTLDALAAGRAKRPLFEWNNYFPEYGSRGWVRKMACAYGWDWGPVVPTAGIWQDISLVWDSIPPITNFHIRQHHDTDQQQVRLHCSWEREIPLQTHLRNYMARRNYLPSQ